MTVIKGNKRYFTKPSSTQASDTESLHLGSGSITASDNESLNNEPITRPIRIFQALPLRPVILDDPVNLKKASGKKKVRRHQNVCILQTLHEEDEIDIIIMESYKGPFARLLQDSEAMEFWNNFIEKSEKEQTDIINEYSNKYNKSRVDGDQNITDRPLGKISSRAKRTFKTKKQLSIETVKGCEYEMLQFFNLSPNDVYTKSSPTSFDRLLLRAIANHHGLTIKNIHPTNDNEKAFVEISNTNENWAPASCFLTDFIRQLRMDLTVSS